MMSTRHALLVIILIMLALIPTIIHSYLNLKTGDKIDLPEAKFYTLPTAKRVLKVGIPAKIKKGNYSITALVDYGPEMELKIGEMEIEL